MARLASVCAVLCGLSSFVFLPAAQASDIPSPPSGGSAPPVESAASATAALPELAARVSKQVETLRGWKFKRPVAVNACTQEEFSAFMRDDGGVGGAGEGGLSPADRMERMIGLVPKDAAAGNPFAEAMDEYVPGIYDHRTRTVRMVERPGVDYGALFTQAILAHELTHALDHQYFESMFAKRTSRDAEFAAGAVYEGSAITVQTRFEREAMASARHQPSELMESMTQQMKMGRIMVSTPAYVMVPFVARFPCGSRFLQRGARAVGVVPAERSAAPDALWCVGDAMKRVGGDLPRSSEQVLHPEKYWDRDKRDDPVDVSDGEVEAAIRDIGLRLVHADTFGELYCALLTGPPDKTVNPMAMARPGTWTNDAATGWDGDRFFLLTRRGVGAEGENEGGAIAAAAEVGLWITIWDTPADRDEFVEAYEKARPMPSRSSLKVGDLCGVFFYAFGDALAQTVWDRVQRRLADSIPIVAQP